MHALFARIRASQAGEVLKEGSGAAERKSGPEALRRRSAAESLASSPEDHGQPGEEAQPERDSPPPGTKVADAGDDASEVFSADESLLQRRDALMEPIAAGLARRLKRALQDEQNDALDRIRSQNDRSSVDAIMGPANSQGDRYRRISMMLLEEGVLAGASLTGAGDRSVRDARSVAAEEAYALAAAVAGPLRKRVEEGFEEVATGDESSVADHLGAAYRELKGQRIESIATDHVSGAMSRGVLKAVPKEATLRWVVDDDGTPCPDCDDNGLAGPLSAGESYPTGQSHPPAHPGCRCLLTPDSA